MVCSKAPMDTRCLAHLVGPLLTYVYPHLLAFLAAAQVVPAIAPRVAALTVFQRKAAWVVPRGDYAYPFVVRSAFAWVPFLMYFYRTFIFFLLDAMYFIMIRPLAPFLRGRAEARAHSYLKRVLPGPERAWLRAALTPGYPFACKRVVVSDDYLQAFRLPHVSLVTGSILRVEPRGIVTRAEGGGETLTELVCLRPLSVAHRFSTPAVSRTTPLSVLQRRMSSSTPRASTSLHRSTRLALSALVASRCATTRQSEGGRRPTSAWQRPGSRTSFSSPGLTLAWGTAA